MSSLATQGVVDDFPFVAINWTCDGDRLGQFYVLNVKTHETRPISRRFQLFELQGSSAVLSGSCIYIIADRDLYCGSSSYKGCDDLLFEDRYYEEPHLVKPYHVEPPRPLESDWTKASPMLSNRYCPLSVLLNGKIYVVGRGDDHGFSAEVFDTSKKIWTVLDTPNPNFVCVSHPILADLCRRWILVHDPSTKSLHGYSIDDKEWKYLNENYDEWHISPVAADGVIYSLSSYVNDYEVCEGMSYRFSSTKCSLRAYDVDGKKPLYIKWLPLSEEEEVEVPSIAALFHLGFDKFCLAWDCYSYRGIRYMKFSVSKNLAAAEIIATPEPIRSIPCKGCGLFGSFYIN